MTTHLMSRPHRRLNLLTGEYILVSPHRTQRPWQGKKEKISVEKREDYDSKCYLCPGNSRINGKNNPDYEGTYVFQNDFQAILPDGPMLAENIDEGLFKYQGVRGTCHVICYSPRHDLTMAEMSPDEISAVIKMWQDESNHLGHDYKWVQIFENRGEIMGCSNPHPHGQVWASNFLPNEGNKEEINQHNYYKSHGRSLLLDYVEQEIEKKERLVYFNDEFAALVPFWATWPFETIVLPRFSVQKFTGLTERNRQQLASCLKELLIKYDNLFSCSFPYSMGWHQAPFERKDLPYWQLHGHFYPPLLRSATVKKFMVGYEMLSEAQRDLTAEQAAEQLRRTSSTHYLQRRTI